MILTIVLTLVTYSAISCIVYFITKDDERVLSYFGIGIVGLTFGVFLYAIDKFMKWRKYKDKRSIIRCPDDSRKYCPIKCFDYFRWHRNYYGCKRYAEKEEWSTLDPFTKEELELLSRNCENCSHDGKECPKGSDDDTITKCLCCLPKDQWINKWSPELDDNYPCWVKK